MANCKGFSNLTPQTDLNQDPFMVSKKLERIAIDFILFND